MEPMSSAGSGSGFVLANPSPPGDFLALGRATHMAMERLR